jgi:hypothetical protein
VVVSYFSKKLKLSFETQCVFSLSIYINILFLKKMRKSDPQSAAVVAQSIGRGVTRSLYRSLLQEARKLDNSTISKVLLPIPRKLQLATGLSAPLYVPNGVKYQDLVKRAFRAHKPGEAGNPVLAFEALNMFRAHQKTVESLIDVATREHNGLVKALEEANPDPSQYWVKPILDPTQQQRLQQERMEEEAAKLRKKALAKGAAGTELGKSNEKIKVGVEAQGLRTPDQEKTIKDLFSRPTAVKKSEALAKLGTVEPQVGMALVAHPLSSAHIDRRVMLIVETNPQMTTGLVLDMFYTFPLSHGSRSFPEVFWGHEVYNGGYQHVDFTMPPTANISILHTLPPPCDTNTTASYNARWLNWALRNARSEEEKGGGLSGGGSSASASAVAHHERFCKPIIRGDGKNIPTLYYSKVEALSYLASIVPGQPRSDLRIYWGSMKWSTTQLTSEIKNGHWIPVNISPKFFAAYPVIRNGPGNTSSSSSSSNPSSSNQQQQHHHIDCFPTENMLSESKQLRTKLLGADIVPPQTFPPDQQVVRRESLWDQMMLALGGEYKTIVGSVNPFVAKQQQQAQQASVTATVPGVPASFAQLESSLDDDDDEHEDHGDDFGDDVVIGGGNIHLRDEQNPGDFVTPSTTSSASASAAAARQKNIEEIEKLAAKKKEKENSNSNSSNDDDKNKTSGGTPPANPSV